MATTQSSPPGPSNTTTVSRPDDTGKSEDSVSSTVCHLAKGDVTTDVPPRGSDTSAPRDILRASSTDTRDSNTEFDKFHLQHTIPFLQLLSLDDFEYGYTSSAEQYLRAILRQSRPFARQWIGQVCISLFGNRDSLRLERVLRVLENLDYTELDSQGLLIAIMATRYHDPLVREAGIRAFESWPSLDSLRVLQAFSCDEPWLRSYVDRVIADISEELELDGLSRSQD